MFVSGHQTQKKEKVQGCILVQRENGATKFLKSPPKYSHLKRRFDLDKDFVYSFKDTKVFCIRIKSHKGAAE